MNKSWKYIVFIFIVGFAFTGCRNNEMKIEIPKDFSFILDYGVTGKNQIDTFKGTFTKDLVTVPPVTTELKLTEEEINGVYIKMKEINILNYPDNFYEETKIRVTPANTYKFKIACDSKIKEINWVDETSSESQKAIQLRALIEKIKIIIENKNEYKKLPDAVGGYL